METQSSRPSCTSDEARCFAAGSGDFVPSRPARERSRGEKAESPPIALLKKIDALPLRPVRQRSVETVLLFSSVATRPPQRRSHSSPSEWKPLADDDTGHRMQLTQQLQDSIFSSLQLLNREDCCAPGEVLLGKRDESVTTSTTTISSSSWKDSAPMRPSRQSTQGDRLPSPKPSLAPPQPPRRQRTASRTTSPPLPRPAAQDEFAAAVLWEDLTPAAAATVCARAC